MPTKVIFQPDA